MLNIFKLLIIIIVFSFIAILIWGFIRDTRIHNKRMSKLEQWSKFNSQLSEWSKEIVDISIQSEYVNDCMIHTDYTNISFLDNWDINEEKKKVCEKWGYHIPSLLKEIREKKLKEIGIYDKI